ncbi:MAG: SMC-Scp complex subunit ScpB [Polyangiaceae bacterium]
MGEDASANDTETFLKAALESILYVADKPLTIKDIAKAIQLDRRRAEEILESLRADYEQRGFRIDAVADGYCFRTHPKVADYVRAFLEQKPVKLSRAQLETLSIVAYRQPITRPEADEIRGVDCGPVLKGLLERDLIRVIGKKDEPGRPMLYGTTPAFLELFGLKSLEELPTLKEFTELNEDSRRKFEQEMGEEAPLNLSDLGLLNEAEAAPSPQRAEAEQSDANVEREDAPATSGEASEPSDCSELESLRRAARWGGGKLSVDRQ